MIDRQDLHETGERQVLARLLPLYVVVLMGFVGYSLMITVFTPLFLRGDRVMLPVDTPISTRTIILGVLLCLYPLGQFVGSPILGTLSDRFGRRPVLLLSLTVTTACYGLISHALATSNIALLGIASLVAGFSEANIVTAQSAITDVVPAEDRNRYFGYIYMAVSLAYIIGPLAGGKLTEPALVGWFSNATPFWATFVLLVATVIVVFLTFRETLMRDEAQKPSRLADSLTGFASVFTDTHLRRFYALNFLLYLAIFGFFRSYPMYLVDEFGMGVSRVSEFVAWVGVPIVLANLWLTGFLTKHFDVTILTIGSAILMGMFIFAVVIPASETPLWPILFFASAALAICMPSCATLVSNAADASAQGRAMGNNQALQVGAEALSGLLAGLLAAIVVSLPLTVEAAVSIAAAILAIWMFRKKASQNHAPTQ